MMMKTTMITICSPGERHSAVCGEVKMGHPVTGLQLVETVSQDFLWWDNDDEDYGDDVDGDGDDDKEDGEEVADVVWS